MIQRLRNSRRNEWYLISTELATKDNNHDKKEKLKDLQTDLEILEGMIVYTENIIALSFFNVEILKQSSNEKYWLNETMFGCHIDNEEKKL